MNQLPDKHHSKTISQSTEPKKDVFLTSSTMSPIKSAIRLSLFYIVFGSLWIISSDEILELLVSDQSVYQELQTYKGWGYVIITGVLLFFLALRTLKLYEIARSQTIKINEELNQQLKITSETQQRYQLAVDGSHDSIWDFEIQENKFFSSTKLLETMGYGVDELKVSSLEDWLGLIHPDDYEAFYTSISAYLNAGHGNFEYVYRVINKDKSDCWILTRCQGYWDENGKAVRLAGSHTNITPTKKMEEELFRLAYFDSLTKLPNWIKFKEIISSAITHCKDDEVLSLIFIDIDDFKNINDLLGYTVGDQLIIRLAAELDQFLPYHHQLAKIGGDSFGILLNRKKSDNNFEVRAIITNLIKFIQTERSIEEQRVVIFASIGVAQFPSDATDASNLMLCANAAMALAKERGKNNVQFYTHEQHDLHIHQIALISDLHHAIERNELLLYYQPVVRLSDMSLHGFECLLRWKQTEKGFISPDEFITLAENTGIITHIEEWVFEHVMMQVVKWRSINKTHAPIAINLSSRGLVNKDFIDHIESLMKKYNILRYEIEVEITETSFISSFEIAASHVRRLQLLGIKILLDDFGKGYSSLAYLRQLPIDILKIDRLFTNHVIDIERNDYLAVAMIDMAHMINTEVIVEGIENQIQLDYMKKHNAEFGQGYFLHIPSLPEELGHLFTKSE